MTTVMRTESQLLNELARTLCQHPWYQVSDALHEVMAGEPPDRWTNLLASIATALDLRPINAYDADRLATDEEPDHPAAYATRLDEWSIRVDNALLLAEQLHLLADRAARALCDESRSRVGGRARTAYLRLTGATT